MSCADFDDIKTICIEFCKETEDRGVDTPSDELMILPYELLKYQIFLHTHL